MLSTVFFFILRWADLLGVDSVMCPRSLRKRAWERLWQALDLAKLEPLAMAWITHRFNIGFNPNHAFKPLRK